MKKRLLSFLIIGCMLFGDMSSIAYAEEQTDVNGNMIEENFSDNGNNTKDEEESTEDTTIKSEESNDNNDKEDVVTEKGEISESEEETSENSQRGVTEEGKKVEEEQEEKQEEEILYNGFEADYDDPEFSNLLEKGFFETKKGRAKAAYGTQHDKRFEGFDIEDGIDVSKWNGDITWSTVAKTQDFVFIRAAYRGTETGKMAIDPTFKENMREAIASGLQVGVYVFSQAITTAEAREEARYILNLVKGYSFDLPIVFDYEFTAGGRLQEADLSRTEHTNNCKAFCDEIEKSGYTPMLYANLDMLTNYINGKEIDKSGYEVWFARYNSYAGYEGNYNYWQYSSTGKVNGISGNVDMNYHYVEPVFGVPELSSVNATADGLKISWKAVPEAEGYTIFRKSGNSSWKTLGSTEGTSFVDKSAVAGETYTYTVRAYRGGFDNAQANKYDSLYWSWFDSKGITRTCLAIPQLTDAENVSGGIKVTWGAVKGAEKYRVYRKAKGASSWTNLGDVSSTSYTDKAKLESGTTYLYTVRAVQGASTSYFETAGISTIKLDIPQMKSVRKYDDVQITWESVKGAEKYYIYRKIPGNPWSKIGETEDISYTDNSKLETGTEYRYTVRAYNGSERSYYETSGISLVYLDTPKLKSAENASGGIKVSWEAVGGAKQYRVYRKVEGASSWTSVKLVSGTSYTDGAKLEGGSKYLYTVRAVNGSSSSYFEIAGISTIKLDIPQMKSARKYDDVQITWGSVKGAEKYYIYRKIPGNPWSKIGESKSTSYTDNTKLKAGTEYRYTVRAYNGSERSYYVTSGISLVYLDTPKLKSAENASGGIKVTWGSVKGAKQYRVYRKASGASSWTSVKLVSGTSYTDGGNLKSGSKYLYTVRAVSGSSSSYFDTKGITVTKLSVPVLKSATKASSGIKIAWNKVGGAEGYYVYRKTSGSHWKMIQKTTSTSYTDKGASSSVAYIYTVRAYKGSERSWYNTSGITLNSMLQKAQAYSSKTKWLILVDTKKNKTGIYYGSKNNWVEKKNWSCTTGKASTPTVKGSYTVKAKGLFFGHGYTCWYYTQFYGNYLFHSVLYSPGSKTKIQDGRLGQNLSHGCVRLTLKNAKWIYDNIPKGTKVVIY